MLYFEGCPSWRVLDERLRSLSADLGLIVTYEKVETAQAAQVRRFIGSPTLLVNGHDPFARGDEPVGLACRIYWTPDGLAGAPTLDQLRAALTPPAGPSEPAGSGERRQPRGRVDPRP